MKITRQRLKNIIMEEIALQEASPDLTQMTTAPGEGTGQTAYVGNAPANSGQSAEEIGQISENEVEMMNQLAQMVIANTGFENVEQIKIVLDGLKDLGLLALGGGAIGAAAKAGKDAIAKLASQDAAEETETALEEEQEGTLEELITQAIQEELAHLASKKAK